MQQDNTIIHTLQQLEQQQLPDLSHMDAHWAAMEQALQPAATAPSRTRHRNWWIAALLLLATATAGIWALRDTPPVQPPVAASATGSAPSAKAALPPTDSPYTRIVVSGDTVKLIQVPPPHAKQPTTINRSRTRNRTNADSLTPRRKDTVYFNLNFIDCADNKNTAGDGLSDNRSREARRDELMMAMATPEKVYTIDNSLDTLLQCTKGTTLAIPAGSLGGSRTVRFSVKEFYQKHEFVLNQLSATSDKDLLESGGMLQLTATVDDQPVDIVSGFTIRVYMATDPAQMDDMQLFTGERVSRRLSTGVVRFDDQLRDITNGPLSTYVNWTPQSRRFSGMPAVIQARVLNLLNEPRQIIRRKSGTVAIFYRAPGSPLSRQALQKELTQRYDYHKIKVKPARRWRLFGSRTVATSLGDSAWIQKGLADRNKIPYTRTRVLPGLDEEGEATTRFFNMLDKNGLRDKLGVDINQLGWINCDRFYRDQQEKVDYVVELNDAAEGYGTVLVFDRINAVMNGYVSGNSVYFTQVPVGEKVTVVSIGINAKGKSVYGTQKAIVNRLPLKGMVFTEADAATIKAAIPGQL
jgi:hypothetical protein